MKTVLFAVLLICAVTYSVANDRFFHQKRPNWLSKKTAMKLPEEHDELTTSKDWIKNIENSPSINKLPEEHDELTTSKDWIKDIENSPSINKKTMNVLTDLKTSDESKETAMSTEADITNELKMSANVKDAMKMIRVSLAGNHTTIQEVWNCVLAERKKFEAGDTDIEGLSTCLKKIDNLSDDDKHTVLNALKIIIKKFVPDYMKDHENSTIHTVLEMLESETVQESLTFLLTVLDGVKHGCYSVSLPREECNKIRTEEIAKHLDFYVLSTPVQPPKIFPDQTSNILDAIASPVLDPKSKNGIEGLDLLLLILDEPKWALHYLTMDIRSQQLAQRSITPGNLGFFQEMSEYGELVEWYKKKEDASIFNIPIIPLFQMKPYMKNPADENIFLDVFENGQWKTDKVFVMQRLAGLNPMSIRLMNNLDMTNKCIGDNWDGAIMDASGSSLTMQQAIDDKKLFIVDYPLLRNLTEMPDITDYDPYDNRTVRPNVSPFAIFLSKKDDDDDDNSIGLVVVGIQLDWRNGAAVVKPSDDPKKWLNAKMEVQRADILYVELIEHLLNTHLLLEPICVILHRTMSKYHPLHQIWSQHCNGINMVNMLGLPALFDEKSFLHILFTVGNKGGIELLNRGYNDLTWDVTDFEANLQNRGVMDNSTLPYFPYRDDGLLTWNVITDYANEYIDLYYKDDEEVKHDMELQRFAKELSADGEECGGMGMLNGFPKEITKKLQLKDIMKRIVFIPVQHSAINYPISYYGAYVPNMPTKIYNDNRVPKGEFDFKNLPQSRLATYQVALSMALGSLRYDRILDYKKLDDMAGRKVAKKYYRQLMKDIDSVDCIIQYRNQRRHNKKQLTYPYLQPRWTPNSIHT